MKTMNIPAIKSCILAILLALPAAPAQAQGAGAIYGRCFYAINEHPWDP